MGDTWYKHSPEDYLDGIKDLPADLALLYTVILNLLYMHGGRIAYGEPMQKRIASYTGGKGATWVRRGIERLVNDYGKLAENEGYLTNERVTKEVSERRRSAQKPVPKVDPIAQKLEKNPEKTSKKPKENLEKTSSLGGCESNENNDLKNTDIRDKIRDNIPPYSPPKGGSAEPDGFEEFWRAYPRRNGVKSGKAGARKKYDKALKQISAEEILSAVKKYAETDAVKRGFAKDASTWLNGQCWADEIGAAQPSSDSLRRELRRAGIA